MDVSDTGIGVPHLYSFAVAQQRAGNLPSTIQAGAFGNSYRGYDTSVIVGFIAWSEFPCGRYFPGFNRVVRQNQFRGSDNIEPFRNKFGNAITY